MTEGAPSLAPTTTPEQDRKTAGQRTINLMWEQTQALIAKAVVLANIIFVFANPFMPVIAKDGGNLLSNAFFLVIGFYFGRTNHARTGGVGGDDVKESR